MLFMSWPLENGKKKALFDAEAGQYLCLNSRGVWLSVFINVALLLNKDKLFHLNIFINVCTPHMSQN